MMLQHLLINIPRYQCKQIIAKSLNLGSFRQQRSGVLTWCRQFWSACQYRRTR